MTYDGYTIGGRFIADGNAADIIVRGDIDWMTVINATVTLAGGAGSAVRFEWFRGLGDGIGIVYNKLAADDSVTQEITAAGAGFTLIDSSGPELGAILASTQIQAGPPPVVLSANTGGLVNGDIVRIVSSTNAEQLGGVDFQIGAVNPNVSFTLAYMPAIVATGVVAGSYYPVRFDPIYYPRRRFIASITQANPAVITTTVDHGFTVGQQVRLQVPADFDMVEIDGLTATVTAVTANTITTDINSAAFAAFAWPLTGDVPFTHAQVLPVGEVSGTAGAIPLSGATRNTGEIFMRLAAGVNSPAGAANDVIYWKAGRYFSIDNE